MGCIIVLQFKCSWELYIGSLIAGSYFILGYNWGNFQQFFVAWTLKFVYKEIEMNTEI